MEREIPEPERITVWLEELQHKAKVLDDALVKASMGSHERERLPFEREFQIRKFLAHSAVYIHDLREWYQRGRLDWLTQTLRNLMELNVWAEFCNASEANWRRFVDDSTRDLKELLTISHNLSTKTDPDGDAVVAAQIATVDEHAKRIGIDMAEKYLRVDKAAEQLNKRHFIRQCIRQLRSMHIRRPSFLRSIDQCRRLTWLYTAKDIGSLTSA
jgi:hypothetical protein